MPSENKKSYKEIAENNIIPRNTLLKDVYAKLEQTPEADMQARVTEIREALAEVNMRTGRMHRRMQTKSGTRGRSAEEIKANAEEIKRANIELDEISLIGTRLENEAEMLEYFPKVRATMQTIKSAEEKAAQEEIDARRTVEVQEKLLDDAKKAAEKAIEAEKKVKEIKAQIEELKEDLETAKAKGRKPKVIEGLEEEIADKEAEMAELGTPEDWKKAIDEQGRYESELAKAVINQNEQKNKKIILLDPWNTIIKDKLWTELGDLTSEDISKLVGTEVEKPEAKWAEKPAEKSEKDKEDKNKDKDKDNGKRQNSNNVTNYLTPYITPTQQQPKLEEEEKENEEPTESDQEHETEVDQELEEEIENLQVEPKKHNIFVRLIPPLARWIDKTEPKQQAFIEKFRKENKGEPSWFQKLKARFSKTPIQVEYEEPERSPEDIERAKKLIEKNREAKEKSKEIVERIKAQYKTEEEQIAAITQELSTMTSEEIIDIAPLWEGLISDKAIDMAYNAALLREMPKSKKAQEYENEAKKEREKTSSKRQEHEDFKNKINGGEQIPTPTAPVEHVEAELISENDRKPNGTVIESKPREVSSEDEQR